MQEMRACAGGVLSCSHWPKLITLHYIQQPADELNGSIAFVSHSGQEEQGLFKSLDRLSFPPSSAHCTSRGRISCEILKGEGRSCFFLSAIIKRVRERLLSLTGRPSFLLFGRITVRLRSRVFFSFVTYALTSTKEGRDGLERATTSTISVSTIADVPAARSVFCLVS